MTLYKKTVRTGKFAKGGVDFKENDLITILDEGVEVENPNYGKTDTIFKVRVPNGSELAMRFNKVSLNNMIDAFGSESKEWVGKQVKAWRIMQSVQGKMLKVTYLSHPDAEIDDQGNFAIPGKARPESEDESIEQDLEDIGF